MFATPVEVYALLTARAPRRRWDVREVTNCCTDFPDVDVLAVAGRCAQYLNDTPGARNGPRTFRTFLERERDKREQQHERLRAAKRLARYDRTENQ